ncbi:hypothetical protein PN462_17425 [Spirulina sp. CS-785/01]|uniref:PIN-like domain-containing protein n=1 Tax=Spirulina sp. CS-785/01 TaxID=3021716 RepID=UPI00232AB3CF|nr:hypothetical protein [Spirulina sp. CS-785/01]MDB9314899.1 hypothetical protein [Spirulina sp. CS-785/01]
MTSASSTVTFFIDRCLGKHPILETLRATGITVEIHDDHFPQNAQDVEWIPEIGRRGEEDKEPRTKNQEQINYPLSQFTPIQSFQGV